MRYTPKTHPRIARASWRAGLLATSGIPGAYAVAPVTLSRRPCRHCDVTAELFRDGDPWHRGR